MPLHKIQLFNKAQTIVVCLAYGLGNQLFEWGVGYAAARRLRLPAPILDTSWYELEKLGHTPRHLSLLQFLPRNAYSNLWSYGRANLLYDRFCRLTSFGKLHRYGVPLVHADRETVDRPMAFMGVTCDYRLMENFLPEIRNLVRKSLVDGDYAGTAKNHYAFVHVRRGDFVSDARVNRKYIVLGNAYFERAMALYEKNFGRKQWVLCSDDMEKAQNVISSRFDVTPSTAKDDVGDFATMSLASGGVISNSSFSLFAGLMNELGNGIISPGTWRKDRIGPQPLPNCWHIIDNYH